MNIKVSSTREIETKFFSIAPVINMKHVGNTYVMVPQILIKFSSTDMLKPGDIECLQIAGLSIEYTTLQICSMIVSETGEQEIHILAS